jgi:hypothetical protein
VLLVLLCVSCLACRKSSSGPVQCLKAGAQLVLERWAAESLAAAVAWSCPSSCVVFRMLLLVALHSQLQLVDACNMLVSCRSSGKALHCR